MTRLHFVKKARKDIPDYDIKKGDSYYWWKFAYGRKQCSKTRPERSRLTQSEFFSQLYAIEDNLYGLTAQEDLESARDDIVSELETLRDECQDKHDNMPEQLQDSGSGELLQNRVDSLDEFIDELNDVDLEVDEELKDEELEDRQQEVLDELQAVCYNGE